MDFRKKKKREQGRTEKGKETKNITPTATARTKSKNWFEKIVHYDLIKIFKMSLVLEGCLPQKMVCNSVTKLQMNIN